MAALRVLTVVSRLSRAGGIPSVVRAILNLSDPGRVEHHMCQLRPLEGLNRKELIDSIPSLRDVYTLDLRGRWTRSPRSLPASYRLLRLIRSINPDVVHLHTGSSLIAWPSKLALGATTNWLLDMHEPLGARHSDLTARIVAGMARHDASCVVHSPPVASAIQTELGIPQDRITMIPLGIDLKRFESPRRSRSEWRSDLGLDKETTLVVTVGRVSALKGIWRLLEVAEQTRVSSSGETRIAFAVIGRLGDENRLRAELRARNLQDTIHLLGFVDDLPSALHAADIYFAPSSYEGFGLAVVEGMACGLPVVASSVGGLTYVVNHGDTGYLIDPDDIGEFVAHLGRLNADAGLRRSLGENGRSLAYAEFEEGAMVSGYERLYEKIVNKSS